MNTSLQKLRIHALLMRCQEIQESKIRKIQVIGSDRSVGKFLTMGMDFGPILISPKPIESKSIEFKDDYNKVFGEFSKFVDSNPSKYFGKPKNNYKL